MSARRAIEILLVEDNPGDARLAREALKDAAVHNNLNWVADGVEALAYVKREGKHANATRPDIIVLDLNLPRKNGREVLAEIKAHDDYKGIPIVVLTSSAAEEDIQRVTSLDAHCYITKPMDLDEYIQVARTVERLAVGSRAPVEPLPE